MAKIRSVKTKNKGTRYRAEICVNGVRESKTKPTKLEAQTWAVNREAELSDGSEVISGYTMADAFKRYREECLPMDKAGRDVEIGRFERWEKSDLGKILCTNLTAKHAHDYIRMRLEAQGRARGTVQLELTLLKQCVKKCVVWAWMGSYPWTDVDSIKKSVKIRTKTYTDKEVQLLLDTVGWSDGDPILTRNQRTIVAFLFARETAMRMGEICRMEWKDLHIEKHYVHLPKTKNGDPRDVGLSSRAIEILEQVIKQHKGKHKRVFGESVTRKVTQAFYRLRKRVGINDGTFHDSRRDGTTLLADHLNVLELAATTGHKDIKMLQTYFKKTPTEIANKLP